jgi:NAD(P)-dependent dehydrogenase (short-subunit alcohol dehydrogenase family)
MNRIAFVTGANRGIGFAITSQLAELGYSVFLGSRDLMAGKNAAASLRQRGLNVMPIRLDLSDVATVDAAIAEIESANQPVDTLVNNAGVLDKVSLLELSETQIEESIAVHLKGPLHLARAFVPGMIASGYGRIVNVSSNWGSFAEGMDGPGMYGITKAALNALTVRLAKELPATVKVNAMCPGWVKTRMGGDAATRLPAEGADTAVWLATLPNDGPTGGFFRARKPLGW